MKTVVYQDDMYQVRWNQGSTFNVYIKFGFEWKEVSVFTVYFDALDQEDMARTIAEQHIKEIFLEDE